MTYREGPRGDRKRRSTGEGHRGGQTRRPTGGTDEGAYRGGPQRGRAKRSTGEGHRRGQTRAAHDTGPRSFPTGKSRGGFKNCRVTVLCCCYTS